MEAAGELPSMCRRRRSEFGGPWGPRVCLTWSLTTARQGFQEAGSLSRGDDKNHEGVTASSGLRNGRSRAPWDCLTWSLATCVMMH